MKSKWIKFKGGRKYHFYKTGRLAFVLCGLHFNPDFDIADMENYVLVKHRCKTCQRIKAGKAKP